ncbi:MAG: HDOD domain-containing protein [Candidatus Thiodiazotropha lotti]|uniref:Histidine kinase n=1 Tax=Candidatus Thiodiazotropha endoloripes TaxID=1818881 RepID=A0A1E2URX1_9GAMM|nr:HDOD domain-containing protein [Candidatus Thiodiazotropha endoloripes]MCG7898442.1 HDOD domain-containing protein [Candidatus Thiodiazotropha weberae]MCG7990315.1 HDOD domain-containing protein [Candidatus Thiodiazotropha lotti]MCG7902677.1 HDOD domain-containing protein [Candidatus Thiodiazotropha weberae]MCG7913412.1 HDOD domain-containing protein [Candidatus Thiodiazotropha weberae]MCG7999048.1 HDOD domain-containing protein [Candidatus Thiodiazotropha lotti]
MIDEKQFLNDLNEAIDSNKLTLPTLPEVALKVRDAVEQETSSANEIADIIASDAALSARLLQVANSPLYRGRVPIDNLQMAVARLGVRLVRSLVISLIMQQIFQATDDLLDAKFHQIWEESVQIAAISRVLSYNLDHLDKEQAMLAGLIHNIGALPVLAMAETRDELVQDATELDRVIDILSPQIGQRILEMWDFPESLIKVPANFLNLEYESEGGGDYSDIVLVARLQANLNQNTDFEMPNVPAIKKLGMEPEVNIIEIEGVAEDIQNIEVMFHN